MYFFITSLKRNKDLELELIPTDNVFDFSKLKGKYDIILLWENGLATPSKGMPEKLLNIKKLDIYFDQNLNLNEQKQKISNKVKDLDNKIISIKTKLKNKSFLKNAPKQIISRDKKALIDYEIELKKLNSILNSIKN